PARIFPPGTAPPLPRECQSTTDTLDSCNACCRSEADRFRSEFRAFYRAYPGEEALDKPQVEDYLRHCAVECANANFTRQGQSPNAKCLSSTLSAKGSSTNQRQSCVKNEVSK